MEWMNAATKASDFLKKYKIVGIMLVLGICIMLMPSKSEKTEKPNTAEPVTISLQDSMAEILSKLAGAGKVEVLLTQKYGPETVYQTNQDIQTDDTRTDRHMDTVTITNASREETGLVRQLNPPVYQGALILCQGADSAKVKLSIVEAVMSVTGLPSNCITVLKMK